MADSSNDPARPAKIFAVAKQPEVFRGAQSVTGLRWLSKHNALIGAAMDRRVIHCDLTATAPPADAAKDKGQANLPPSIAATFLSWSHENWICHLDVHPQGDRIATAGADRHVRLWRWGEDQPLAVLKGHKDWVRAVAFSPDGQRLASAGDDGLIHVWDTDRASLLAVLDSDTNFLETVCWTPDGKHLAAAGLEAKIFVWDVEKQEMARPIETVSLRTIEDEVLNGGFSYPGGIRRLACSPSGHHIAAAGLYALTVVETDSGQESFKFSHARNTKVRYFGVAFHPSGQAIAYSQDDVLAVWDLTMKKVTWQTKVDQLGVFDICFLDGGKQIAVGGSKGWIGVWDLA